jgi:putative ABC transport system permease protein
LNNTDLYQPQKNRLRFMMIRMAWRNVWRNKKRSITIISAVIIGLWAGIFLMAFYNGMIEQRIKSAISSEVSHMQLHHPEFRTEYDLYYFLNHGKDILNTIQSDEHVVVAAGRVIIKGMLASPYGSSGITINGVMPNEEKEITGLADKLTQGNYFSAEKENELLISERLQKKLKLKLKNKAIITFQDKDGTIISGAFRVAGFYKTINAPYDDSNIFVKIMDVDSISGLKDQYNEIAVLLTSNQHLGVVQKKLSQLYPETEVKSWMEITPELGLTVSVGDQMVFIFMGIILLALAFGIVNTMMMAILERTREIGMLMALGMNKLKVFSMIVFETFFLVLAGCPFGIFFALISIGIFQKTGINLKQFMETYSSFGYSNIIYPSLSPKHFGMILLLVIITAFVSSLFPARRALRLKPAQSIRK